MYDETVEYIDFPEIFSKFFIEQITLFFKEEPISPQKSDFPFKEQDIRRYIQKKSNKNLIEINQLITIQIEKNFAGSGIDYCILNNSHPLATFEIKGPCRPLKEFYSYFTNWTSKILIDCHKQSLMAKNHPKIKHYFGLIINKKCLNREDNLFYLIEEHTPGACFTKTKIFPFQFGDNINLCLILVQVTLDYKAWYIKHLLPKV